LSKSNIMTKIRKNIPLIIIIFLFIPIILLYSRESSENVYLLKKQDSIKARVNENSNDSIMNKTSSYYYIYDAAGNVIGGSFKIIKVGSVKLTDSLTNNYFVMDSTHVYVTAFEKSGTVLWKTDPYMDSKIPEYRTKRPKIVNFIFGESPDYLSNEIKKGTKVIWIRYNNTGFGFLNIQNGKFYHCGQD
jgi:hypothetical protein